MNRAKRERQYEAARHDIERAKEKTRKAKHDYYENVVKVDQERVNALAAYNKEWRIRNAEYVREYDRKRYSRRKQENV